MRKWLLIFFAFLFAGTCSAEALPERSPANRLLDKLLSMYKEPSADLLSRIDEDVAEMDDPLMSAVSGYWKEIYLDASFRLYYDSVDDPSLLEIPDPSRHAFVVLGYCLKDGEMEPELKKRCKAAATVAAAFPEAVLICTGGPTGINNPDRHTEAGLMARYIRKTFSIPSARIFLDEAARTTVENALYSFRILRDNGIKTITLVTSGYHMRWALMIFHAAAEQSRLDGYPVEIIGNWCCDVPPAPGYDETNPSIAISQLRMFFPEE